MPQRYRCPSGLKKKPDVSKMNGPCGIFAGLSNTKTQRLRGTTGTSSPAIRPISPLHGPAALTTVPHASRPPSASSTAPTRPAPAISSPVTVPATYSTPWVRALRLKACSSAGPSNQPSFSGP